VTWVSVGLPPVFLLNRALAADRTHGKEASPLRVMQIFCITI
jgi:hypothetical protein